MDYYFYYSYTQANKSKTETWAEINGKWIKYTEMFSVRRKPTYEDGKLVAISSTLPKIKVIE